MSFEGKRVLVTGAGGFIGSHLAERLVEQGASVRAMVRYSSSGGWGWLDESEHRDELDVVASDITDPDGVRRAVRGCDVVFHLAALIGIPYSYEAPRSYLRTNIEGTVNVLQAALAEDVARVVHTSTSEVYGTAQQVPIGEDHPLAGQSPYSASKIAADKMAEAFHRSFELPVATVRPFNTFGPRQSDRAIIPTIITQLLWGDELRLGSLHPTRDFNFVGNTVDGFLAAATAEAAVGGVFNVGTGREIRIGDLVTLLVELTGRDVPLEVQDERVRPPASEVERLLANVDRAADALGYAPRVTLEQGLGRTIDWIRDRRDRFRVGEYVV
jgi:NAD dependent epimerase/dehydratase